MGSGSSGNAILIDSADTKVLIDAGFSCREIFKRLNEVGIDPFELTGLIVTHEHSDHTKGIAVLAKKLNIPIYLTKGTWKAIEERLPGHNSEIHTFSPGEGFQINGIGFESFPVLHDAADPVGFCFYYNGLKAGLATDLGKVTHIVRESLKGANCLILESNHDPGMLFRGPYPWWLKQRIRGRFGHLSNEASASLLNDLLHDSLKHVVMAHISQTNNQQDIVHLNALKVLQKKEHKSINLHLALQDKAIKPIELI